MDIKNYQIDSTDRKILHFLCQDARMPYLEIARKLKVSGGMIHQRIQRMSQLGIIKGSRIIVDSRTLGMNIWAIVGIHLTSAKVNQNVMSQLKAFPEIVEAYYTTGKYALVIKVCVPSIKKFYQLLSDKLQSIDEIQSTESFICLDQPIDREIDVLQMAEDEL